MRQRIIAIGAGVLLAGGCASGPRLFVNQDADMTLYRQVAFLPFTNLSTERFAAERVSRALMTELIIANRYKILEASVAVDAFNQLGVTLNDPTRPVPPEKLKQAGQQLGVQGFIRGAVTEYEVQRSGGDEAAALSFDVEMLDAETGNVVWRASVSRRGKGRLPVVGGASTRSFGPLTEDACREVVAQLKANAF